MYARFTHVTRENCQLRLRLKQSLMFRIPALLSCYAGAACTHTMITARLGTRVNMTYIRTHAYSWMFDSRPGFSHLRPFTPPRLARHREGAARHAPELAVHLRATFRHVAHVPHEPYGHSPAHRPVSSTAQFSASGAREHLAHHRRARPTHPTSASCRVRRRGPGRRLASASPANKKNRRVRKVRALPKIRQGIGGGGGAHQLLDNIGSMLHKSLRLQT